MAPKGKSLVTADKQRKPPTEKQLETLKQHAFPPGVSGNPSGRPAKPFTAALLRIVEKKLANDPDGRQLIDAIAQQLVAKASKGDLASIRELVDRIEGTPVRSMEVGGAGGGAIPFVSLTREENERRLQQLMAKVRE